ncbi:MAG: Hsp20/alpha crystallin family protein [Pseudomonadota bacterium]|nr:Hsp20/alpha crystallin family protein [Pseudomonadota bacterium]
MKLLSTPEPFDDTPWRPAADVYRCPEGWLVKFDLAGVCPEDVEVQVSHRGLVVSGIRRDWAIPAGHCFHSMEISYNRFHRCVELPCDPQRAQVSTDYRDGMLLVRLRTGSGR